MAETIKLNINDKSIVFNVTTDAYEKVIDEMRPDSKVTPMHNFLTRTVDSKSKDGLMAFLNNPANIIEIGGKVMEEYAPKLKITVGE